MADQDDSAEKSFEASQRKLDQARKKGDFARSTDLNATAMYLGFLVTGLAVGGGALSRFGEVNAALIGRSDGLADKIFSGGAGTPALQPFVAEIAIALAPLFLVPMAFVAVSIFAQRGFVFAGSKIEPKLSRISLLENLKNKFGSKGLFEFAKSTTKMVIFAWVLFAYLDLRFTEIISGMLQSSEHATVRMLQYTLELLAVVFAISLIVSAVDYGWQKFEHLKKQRMSHKEMRDEMKETEGDPHLKQARRTKAQDIAMNAMLSDVPKADVVVVNPTHYAVALKWSREAGGAPECVAKGVDEIALRIRAIAEESKVPIRSDPPTARALHASIEIGEQILPEHYQAVAAAIRFSDAMRAAARGKVT